MVDKLEKQGYVERQPIPGDQRKTNVALTGEGRTYFDPICPQHVATITDDQEQIRLTNLREELPESNV